MKHQCWQQKQKHDAGFRSASEGYRNNAQKFKDKILREGYDRVVPLRPQRLNVADEVGAPWAATTESAAYPTDWGSRRRYEGKCDAGRGVAGRDHVSCSPWPSWREQRPAIANFGGERDYRSSCSGASE